MAGLDLTDTAEGLTLVNAAFNLPFCVWILNAYFAGIPTELEEAASLDGTGRFAPSRRRATGPHQRPDRRRGPRMRR